MPTKNIGYVKKLVKIPKAIKREININMTQVLNKNAKTII